MIAFSRIKSLLDSLVVAKLPQVKSEGKSMSDFIKNDDSPPCSQTLQILQDLKASCFHGVFFVYIENLRAKTCEYAKSDRYVSQKRTQYPYPPHKMYI